MMHIRCQRCGWSFTLSQEAVAAALEEVEAQKARHYSLECPHCRKVVKIPVRELRRHRPSTLSQAGSPPSTQETQEGEA